MRMRLAVLQVAGLDFDGASAVTAWLAWVPNPTAAEGIFAGVLRRGQRQLRA